MLGVATGGREQLWVVVISFLEALHGFLLLEVSILSVDRDTGRQAFISRKQPQKEEAKQTGKWSNRRGHESCKQGKRVPVEHSK